MRLPDRDGGCEAGKPDLCGMDVMGCSPELAGRRVAGAEQTGSLYGHGESDERVRPRRGFRAGFQAVFVVFTLPGALHPSLDLLDLRQAGKLSREPENPPCT